MSAIEIPRERLLRIAAVGAMTGLPPFNPL
jgi:hypothetical protein